MAVKKQVVLAGAGHAHLHVVARSAALREAGAEVVLVDPGRFWYSGLATGMLGGEYTPEEDQVDPRALAARHGARFVEGRLAGIDGEKSEAILDSDERLGFDFLSLNLGSVVDDRGIPGAKEHTWPVKPIPRLNALRESLEQRLSESGSSPRVVVIGGGATGCEVAANIAGLARRAGKDCRIRLSEAGNRLLAGRPGGAGRWIEKDFRRRGIEVCLNERVARIGRGVVYTQEQEEIFCDATVLATGLRPPDVLSDLGLPLGETAGLAVDAFLRSRNDSRVFGAGDCIDFAGRQLPKLGVFGVRQSPILLRNIIASLHGKPLGRYTPQKSWLSILNLGDGRGLATWGGLYFPGRSALWLKNRLDLAFLRKYK